MSSDALMHKYLTNKNIFQFITLKNHSLDIIIGKMKLRNSYRSYCGNMGFITGRTKSSIFGNTRNF